MVQFKETKNAGDAIETYYPSKLHGFVSINGEWEMMVQCSLKPLCWDDVEQNFIHVL